MTHSDSRRHLNFGWVYHGIHTIPTKENKVNRIYLELYVIVSLKSFLLAEADTCVVVGIIFTINGVSIEIFILF
jgi:hypothetical protein